MDTNFIRTIIFSCSLILYTSNIIAQQVYIKNSEIAQQLKERKLIIVDKVFSTTISNGHKTSSRETENSKLASKTFEHFKKYWNFNSEIEFKNFSEVKNLKKEKSTNFIYAVVEHVKNVHKTTKSRYKPSITTIHKYYAISIYQPEKKREICTIEMKNEHFEDLEIISSINTIQFFLSKIANGSSRNSVFSEVNSSSSQLKNKTLFITNHFSNLAGIEKEQIFPEKIEMVTHSEILDNIESRSKNMAYAIVFHISSPFSKGGENFRTVIIDSESYIPIYIYTWVNLFSD